MSTHTNAIQGLPFSSCSSLDEGKDNRLLRILNLEPESHELYLDIPDTKHGKNKIPLFTTPPSKASTSERPGKTDAENVLVQIYPLRNSYENRLTKPFKPGKGQLKRLREGWFYVYLNGRLWREYRITEEGIYREVALAKDERKLEDWATDDAGTGVATQILMVPHKLGGVEQTVEIAYSETRWTWERIQALGGFADDDPRCSNSDYQQAGDDAKRAARMTKLDLASFVSSGRATDETGKQYICKVGSIPNSLLIHKLRDLDSAAVVVPDALGYLTQLAWSYQNYWREMQAVIDTARKEPHYKSAVLASQAFYNEAPKPTLKFSGDRTKSTVRGTRFTHQYDAARKAYNDRVDKWDDVEDLKSDVRDKIDRSKLEKCLHKKQRHRTRKKIETAKKRLVKYLETEQIMLTQLLPELDDYCALPAEEENFTNAMPCYGDLWGKFEQIFAKLGDLHICDADAGLDIEKVTPDELEKIAAKDVGRKFLGKFLELESCHILQDYLLPLEAEINPEHYDVDRFSQSVQIGRRTAQFTAAFISNLASTITDKVIQTRQIRVAQKTARADIHTKMVYKPLIKLPLIGGILNRKVTVEEATQSKPVTTTTTTAENPDVVTSEQLEKGRKGVVGETIEPVGPAKTSAQTTVDIDELLPEEQSIKAQLKRLWKRIHVKPDDIEVTTKTTTHTSTKTVEQLVVVLPDSKTELAVYRGRKVVQAFIPVLIIFEMVNIIKTLQTTREENLDTEDWLHIVGAGVDALAISVEIIHARMQYKFQSHALTNSARSAAVRSSALLGMGVASAGLGVAAGIYSTALSAWDFRKNLLTGDDAAISHGFITAGFFVATIGSGWMLAAAITAAKAGVAAASTGAGILIGIGLAIVALGLVLLSCIWTEDSVLEIWGDFGPFGKRAFRAGVQEEDTPFEIDPKNWANPAYADHAYEYLLNALYPINVTTQHNAINSVRKRTNKKANNSYYWQPISGNRAFTQVQVPYFLTDRSQAEIVTMLEWEEPDPTYTAADAEKHWDQQLLNNKTAVIHGQPRQPLKPLGNGNYCYPKSGYASCQDGDVLLKSLVEQTEEESLWERGSTYDERMNQPLRRLRLHNLTNIDPSEFVAGTAVPTFSGAWSLDSIMAPTQGVRIRTVVRVDVFGDGSVQFPLRSFKDFKKNRQRFAVISTPVNWHPRDGSVLDAIPTDGMLTT